MHAINNEYLVDLINASPTRAVIIATGGGTGVFDEFLSHGNGSKTLIAGHIPYTSQKTIELLGATPEKFCSDLTARQLAMVAFQEALKVKQEEELPKEGGKYSYDPYHWPVVGVSCTAALQGVPTEREGRVHNIYIALQSWGYTESIAITIEDAEKYFQSRNSYYIRKQEEKIATYAILSLLADACDTKKDFQSIFTYGLKLDFNIHKEIYLGSVLTGRGSNHCTVESGRWGCDTTEDKILLSGSFNPLHDGHREMAKVAEKLSHRRCALEMSMNHVYKPALDYITIKQRVDQLTGTGLPMFITNAPTFLRKSRLFPNTPFAIGYDTALGILDPKYAGPIPELIAEFKKNGTYFYMFPREVKGYSKSEIEQAISVLPGELVSTDMFYRDVSSTEIRKSRAEAGHTS